MQAASSTPRVRATRACAFFPHLLCRCFESVKRVTGLIYETLSIIQVHLSVIMYHEATAAARRWRRRLQAQIFLP